VKRDLYYFSDLFKSSNTYLQETDSFEEFIYRRDRSWAKILASESCVNVKYRRNILNQYIRVGAVILKYIFFSIWTIFSIFLLKKSPVVIWTPDRVQGKYRCDSRISTLIADLVENNVDFIELVHESDISLGILIRNAFLRRRKVIYYPFFELIGKFLGLFNLKIKAIRRKNAIAQGLFRVFFSKFSVNIYIPWFLSSRNASSVFAAKEMCDINVIGFMHSLVNKNYMPHEFNIHYEGVKYFDKLFVFSDYWRNYYQRHSNIHKEILLFNSQSFFGSTIFANGIRNKIVLIDEQLLTDDDLEGCVKELSQCHWICQFEIIIKMRVEGKSKYETLLKERNIIVSYSFDKSVLNSAFLVMGSHSTLVLESVLYSANFLFFTNTFWGNYFNVSSEYIFDSFNDFEFSRVCEKLKQQDLINTKLKYFGSDSQSSMFSLLNLKKNKR
jgi:hypothetical protein